MYYHNCVIIPDFGGFVANYVSAKLYSSQHVFHPPAKTIAFNKNLILNDGLLITHIANQENISYNKANGYVTEFVEECKKILFKTNRFELKNLGIFSYDAENNLQFEPDTSSNYLLDSFGLVEVQSPAIARKVVSKNQKNLEKNRPSIPYKATRFLKHKTVLYYMLPFLLLIGIISVNHKLDNFLGLNYSRLFLFSDFSNPTKNAVSSLEKENISNINNELTTDENLLKNNVVLSDTSISKMVAEEHQEINNSIKTTENITEETSADNKPDSSISNEKFHVIGGVFRDFSNAERLIKKLKQKGFDAKLAGKTNKGLYRVAYDSFTSKAEALALLKTVKVNENHESWLFVKTI